MKTPRPPGGKVRRQHTKEFKINAAQLADRIGFTQAATDLGIHQSMLRKWDRQLRKETGEAFRGHGTRTQIEAQMAILRREIATLKMERDILKKAAIYFAKDER